MKCALLYNEKYEDKHIKDLLLSLGKETNINLAQSIVTPKRVLFFLSSSKSNNVKYELIYNESFLEIITKDMIFNLDEEIKIKAAENPLTSFGILKILANDESFNVKATILLSENTSDEIIKILMKDKDVKLRCVIAENEGTPINILEGLLEDENLSVSKAAKTTLDSLNKEIILKDQINLNDAFSLI